ncbi:MAG TPA: hypothetical protein VHK91_08595 [Flavisolibacter sp.]|jgi:hypothetical protein|nr:hypothetical protein [Flavisolibacter sp.]
MAHDPKLTVHIVKIKPGNDQIENSNRWLFRNIIQEANDNPLDDSYIIAEVFRRFISALDTPAMYADQNSKKCMTANQPNIEDPRVNPNLILHSNDFIIEGRVEGGSYGRRRNKTSTINKADKSGVHEGDAITDDFYFFLYLPPQSNKSVLMLQSYTDDSIDSVMKLFWRNFFSSGLVFQTPIIKRFVPRAIIDDFRRNVSVSGFVFSTEIPGRTLLNRTKTEVNNNYKVTIRITPTNDDLSIEEFEQTLEPIQNNLFSRFRLGDFRRKKAQLRDIETNKTSPFDLGTSFEVKPQILLSKFIQIRNDESDFERIKNFCFELLERIKPEIYPDHAVQER